MGKRKRISRDRKAIERMFRQSFRVTPLPPGAAVPGGGMGPQLVTMTFGDAEHDDCPICKWEREVRAGTATGGPPGFH
jgi:hypothetical protein